MRYRRQSAFSSLRGAYFDRQAADNAGGSPSELQTVDYIVFLFSLDCYIGWIQNARKMPVPNVDMAQAEHLLKRGLTLIFHLENKMLEPVNAYFRQHLSTDKSKMSLLDAAMRPKPDEDGVPKRALKLRLVMKTDVVIKGIFGSSRQAVSRAKEAIDAAAIDDPDVALGKFSAITVGNTRLASWIDLASDLVVSPGTTIVSPVRMAVQAVSDATDDVLSSKIQQGAQSGTEGSAAATEKEVMTLGAIEVNATEMARKAMAKSGEEDRPVTKAEVIGIAAAAVTAVASNPEDPKNIPPALRSLDPEQRAAAMTGGKVRVSAGAGSGKSTTLLARVQYLLDNGATPNRIVAMSFNAKAAEELGQKLASKVGSNRVSTSTARNAAGVSVGTMHGIFLRAIKNYGTPEQADMFSENREKKGGIVHANAVFQAVKNVWKECFNHIDKDPPGDPDGEDITLADDELWKMPPKSSRMMAYINVFTGQGMSFKQAQQWAAAQGTIEADQAIKFYEVYEGLKGAFGPGWRPNLCPQTSEGGRKKPSDAAEKFIRDYRLGKPRVGDFNDMLLVFRDLIRDNPSARKSVQDSLDHIMVDECQDLNPIQTEVLMLMTEHIETDDPKKSFWMVGDDKQSIYQFRGANPNDFINLDKMGFKDRQITTNYRCAPEFVDAANRLIAKNPNQIPMEAKARPDRARGEASLLVAVTGDEGMAAGIFAEKLQAGLERGQPLSDFAVLAATHAELAAFQQVCAIMGRTFVQKRHSSVFGSQESATFKEYLNAVMGSPAQVRDSFSQFLTMAGVFLPKLDQTDKKKNTELQSKAMKKALASYCSKKRIDLATFDPVRETNNNPSFLPDLLLILGVYPKAAKEDATLLEPLFTQISLLRAELEPTGDPSDALTTKGLFDAILGLPIIMRKPPPPGGDSSKWEKSMKSFGEATKERLSARLSEEEEVDTDLDTNTAGDKYSALGTLSFLQMMMEPPTENQKEVLGDYNPTDPQQFYQRFNGLADRAEDLRIDPDEWDKKQKDMNIPLANRTVPPGVYLGTVHSTKGAEWSDVTLLMPAGKFPRDDPSKKPPTKPKRNTVPEVSLVPYEQELEASRRLGYVGLTRAKQNLTVLCPGGASRFIAEAGLVPGENVKKPETATPGFEVPTDATESPNEEAEATPPVIETIGGVVKTAAWLPLINVRSNRAYSYDRSKQ
jgi:superfamily I DNA/RNA helicase